MSPTWSRLCIGQAELQWQKEKEVLQKFNISSSKPLNDPAIPLQGIYPEETKTENNTCTPVFIAALFAIARTWKQPRCLLTNQGIEKLWCTYTVDNYSAINSNAFAAAAAAAKSVQSCPSLCNPIDSSPPGFWTDISLDLLWPVWGQFSDTQSLIHVCTFSQGLWLPLKCTI